ncbi:MAG TPA: D-aminoacyl-tRNA deacylase [Fodinibius sp.]|nr:D-aminoacyl-tRNA deacylase [Fodinibius sp.]
MKIVLQRVSEASVSVKKKQIGAINKGLLLLAGIHKDDERKQVEWLAEKILNLRIFNDDEGKMNLSVRAIDGEILVIPQFTLYGDYASGNRPGYFKAAGPRKAEKLYERMISYFREESDLKIESGSFGAHMDVRLHNDGPVTLVLER